MWIWEHFLKVERPQYTSMSYCNWLWVRTHLAGIIRPRCTIRIGLGYATCMWWPSNASFSLSQPTCCSFQKSLRLYLLHCIDGSSTGFFNVRIQLHLAAVGSTMLSNLSLLRLSTIQVDVQWEVSHAGSVRGLWVNSILGEPFSSRHSQFRIVLTVVLLFLFSMVTSLERRNHERQQDAYTVILIQGYQSPHMFTCFVHCYTVCQYMGSASFASVTNIHPSCIHRHAHCTRTYGGYGYHIYGPIPILLAVWKPIFMAVFVWVPYR